MSKKHPGPETAQRQYFDKLTDKLVAANDDVTAGKMMSSPGIKVNGKVFAFFAPSGGMVFKLGKGFDPKASGYPEMTAFNPFKNKGPLAGWFESPFEKKRRWEKLAKTALEVVRS